MKKFIISLTTVVLLMTTIIFAQSSLNLQPEIAKTEPLQEDFSDDVIVKTEIPTDNTSIYNKEASSGFSYREEEIDGEIQQIYNGHFVLYNSPLLRDMSWFQPKGFTSYMISITNNSEIPIAITYGEENTRIFIDGNTTKTITNNNAKDDTTYRIDINNSDGSAIDGTISVRISDQPL